MGQKWAIFQETVFFRLMNLNICSRNHKLGNMSQNRPTQPLAMILVVIEDNYFHLKEFGKKEM